MALAGEEKLLKLIRNVSLARLGQQGQIQDLSISDIDGKLDVYSHWMSIILASGPSAKVTFKCHFKTKTAQAMASQVYKLAPEAVTLEQAIDFMREFCNLTAGGVKAALIQHNVKLAISLPIITRGFDEIFFGKIIPKQSLLDCWRLGNLDYGVVCTSAVEFFETPDLTRIDADFMGQIESQSDIELF